MRIASIAVVAALACGLGMAAGREDTVTYLEGNLTGVTPNTGGSLVSAEDAMALKTGLSTVLVPYSSISKAELGAIRQRSEKDPLYKVWSIHKRVIKPENQLLRVDFTNEAGEQKTMTVELARPAAVNVWETVELYRVASEKAARAAQWWGDQYWKTTRNASSWTGAR